jgi:hypothetical protein
VTNEKDVAALAAICTDSASLMFQAVNFGHDGYLLGHRGNADRLTDGTYAD